LSVALWFENKLNCENSFGTPAAGAQAFLRARPQEWKII
jgi:hypothetical protein